MVPHLVEKLHKKREPAYAKPRLCVDRQGADIIHSSVPAVAVWAGGFPDPDGLARTTGACSMDPTGPDLGTRSAVELLVLGTHRIPSERLLGRKYRSAWFFLRFPVASVRPRRVGEFQCILGLCSYEIDARLCITANKPS
ncbi:hypothetical protein A2239_03225 [Candidatus Uhrbacteria bacterium RIFOXYA2_FULL_40_9]|nr:MAG: hypothetical protein A2239_03225 [Candidatus Uhrbacteria bacterium RIFOXYA2_FULL_40_9]